MTGRRISGMAAALFILSLFLFSSAYASQIRNQEVVVQVGDDGIGKTSVDIYFEDLTTTDVYYFVFTSIGFLNASDDYGVLECDTKQYSYGTQLICKPNTENTSNYSVHFDFDMLDLGSFSDNVSFFTYDYSVRTPMNHFMLKFVLPTGMALIEKKGGISPYFPEDGIIGSTEDGRHITITWTDENPSLGDDYSYNVFYEDVTQEITQIYREPLFYPILILAVIVLMFAVFLMFFRSRKSKKINTVLSVLHEGERRVIELLMQNENRCDQRGLVKDTGFSKAKMSRILLDLETRGLVVKTRRGRTNIVELSDKKIKS